MVGQDAYPTTLQGGFNKLAIEYASPERGTAAQFRLMWESSEFAREPVPPSILFHNGDDEELVRFEQLRRGRELFASLKCAACHSPSRSPARPLVEAVETTTGKSARPTDDAPNLARVGRLKPQWLTEWIQQPQRSHADSRMPRLNVTSREATDIGSWLGTKASKVQPLTAVGDVEAGAIAFEELGCIACHRLKLDGADEHQRRSLAHVRDRFQTGQLAAFLLEPQRFHPTSRMPDFHLESGTAASLAAYLTAQTTETVRVITNGESAERGGQLFEQRGCVQCHAVGDQPAKPRAEVAELVDVTAADGCLALQPHQRVGVPHYQLAPVDRAAIVRFLGTDHSSLTRLAPSEAAQSLTKTLRCSACHDRDGSHSPRRAIIAEESDRGLPPEVFPNLTWAGEKLQADWMAHFIGTSQTGKSTRPTTPLRPWLKARMPSFPAYAKSLAEGLAAEHGIAFDEPVSFKAEPKLAELGNALTQRTALDCRQCHAVGLQPAQGDDKTKIAPGINFAIVKDRLRHDYYQRFTLDPPRFDINSKMPKLAADGKTTKVTTILDGDARQQFDAIWHFIQMTKIESP